jgi:hypothetical protein
MSDDIPFLDAPKFPPGFLDEIRHMVWKILAGCDRVAEFCTGITEDFLAPHDDGGSEAFRDHVLLSALDPAPDGWATHQAVQARASSA